MQTLVKMKANHFGFCILGVLAISGCRPFLAGVADELLPVTNSADFAPTVPNTTPPPPSAPEGMVWIPGGEFSMGCKLPSTGYCTAATMNAVNDAQPIHRVYVDGF